MSFPIANLEAVSQATATVDTTIAPNQPGRVWYWGSYWPARLYANNCAQTFTPTEVVSVVGRQGITLLVAPKDS